MKIWYQCEICGIKYSAKKEAKACEGRAVPKPFPVGLVYGHPSSKASHHYTDLVFAIAKVHKSTGHLLVTSLWACRDNGCGDSFDSELCGPGPSHWDDYNITSEMTKRDLEHPCTIRMVAALRDRKIIPTRLVKGVLTPFP